MSHNDDTRNDAARKALEAIRSGAADTGEGSYRTRLDNGLEMTADQQYAFDALTYDFAQAFSRARRGEGPQPQVRDYLRSMPDAGLAFIEFVLYHLVTSEGLSLTEVQRRWLDEVRPPRSRDD